MYLSYSLISAPYRAQKLFVADSAYLEVLQDCRETRVGEVWESSPEGDTRCSLNAVTTSTFVQLPLGMQNLLLRPARAIVCLPREVMSKNQTVHNKSSAQCLLWVFRVVGPAGAC